MSWIAVNRRLPRRFSRGFDGHLRRIPSASMATRAFDGRRGFEPTSWGDENVARTIRLKTAPEVEKLAKQAGMHLIDPGLYLQVKGGAVSWIHRYTIKSKARWSGLGSYPDLSLAAARGKLKDEQAQLRTGVDPVAERKHQRKEKAAAQQPRRTFREVAMEFVANNESEWKNPVHRRQWPTTLEAYVYRVIGDMPVDEIATENVYDVLKPIWYVKRETARRVRGRIE